MSLFNRFAKSTGLIFIVPDASGTFGYNDDVVGKLRG